MTASIKVLNVQIGSKLNMMAIHVTASWNMLKSGRNPPNWTVDSMWKLSLKTKTSWTQSKPALIYPKGGQQDSLLNLFYRHAYM